MYKHIVNNMNINMFNKGLNESTVFKSLAYITEVDYSKLGFLTEL